MTLPAYSDSFPINLRSVPITITLSGGSWWIFTKGMQVWCCIANICVSGIRYSLIIIIMFSRFQPKSNSSEHLKLDERQVYR